MSDKNHTEFGPIIGGHKAVLVAPKPEQAMSRRSLLRGGMGFAVRGGLGGLSALSLSGCKSASAMAATPDPTPAPTTASAATDSSITEYSYISTVLGGSRCYKVYLPAGYAGSGLRYPVIYLLHGRGDSLSSWGRNKALVDELIAAGKIPPVVLIFPDAPSSDRGNYYVDSAYTNSAMPGAQVETEFMRELIPHVDATYRTIANRAARAIGGYSMGGYGALRYALVYPETFSAAIVLSPAVYTPLPPSRSSTREFGAFGRGNKRFVDDIYRAKTYPALLDGFNAKGLKLAMFIAAGDDEYKNPIPADGSNDIDFESALLFNRVSRVSNIDAELRILDGDHDWVVWQPAFREALSYIFKTLRKPE